MPDLKEYIRSLQSKGYSLDVIRQYLLKYGYPQNVIDNAIYNQGNSEKTFHLNPLLIITIVAVIIGVGGVGYFLLKPSSQIPGELLDAQIQNLNAQITPGEDLVADFILTNAGAKQKYDVYLKYEVFDRSGKRITFKSETVAIENDQSRKIQLTLPSDAKEGEYTLQVSARYQGELAQAEAPFTVKRSGSSVQTPTCSDGERNQGEEDVDCGGPCQACRACPEICDDNNPDTTDYCDASSGFECRFVPQAVCGNNLCDGSETEESCASDCTVAANPWDEMDRIKAMAETNPEQAKRECDGIDSSFTDLCLQNVGIAAKDANICDRISEETKRNKCFSDVAKATSTSVLCEKISKESPRNSCYVNFVAMDDFTVCDKLTNEYLKQSCLTLKQTKG